MSFSQSARKTLHKSKGSKKARKNTNKKLCQTPICTARRTAVQNKVGLETELLSFFTPPIKVKFPFFSPPLDIHSVPGRFHIRMILLPSPQSFPYTHAVIIIVISSRPFGALCAQPIRIKLRPSLKEREFLFQGFPPFLVSVVFNAGFHPMGLQLNI